SRKEKQVMSTEFRKNFLGPMNYKVESLFSDIINSEFGTISGINSFGLSSSTNCELSSLVNYELPGSSNFGLFEYLVFQTMDCLIL
ncbi:32540_t:CDS:2, partial [Racocetra persica]